MAILDPPADMLPQEILDWRMNEADYDSKFAALYYPWIKVIDPLTTSRSCVPPCGHMAGVWARTDATRGVHKAPANEVCEGADRRRAPDHPGRAGRPQPGRRSTASARSPAAASGSGARARSRSDPEWRYINVRRLFNYVAESIMEGTQWVVFEPNDEKLWIAAAIARRRRS